MLFACPVTFVVAHLCSQLHARGAMTKFWLYVGLASLALLWAFSYPSHSDSRGWIMGIWWLIGCFPWWLVLPLLIDVTPDTQLTLSLVSAMSSVNALAIFCMCRARMQQVSVLQYMGYQLGRCVSYFGKWH